MKRNLFFIAAAASALCACAGAPECCHETLPCWGDQGNGTYINPILNADFSDPDVTRVGDTYYMVASDFHFMGMQVLQSKDLVNWEYLTQIYDRLEAPGYDSNEHYSHGSWAPTIRYHDGKFYMFVCSPTEGLWMSSAEKAEGPWTKPLLVHEGTGPGWEDPCPFWDEDGNAYLGRSQLGAGPIIIHRMSPDGTKLLDDGVTVYEGPVAEGTKIHKWNGKYYFSIPEGGVGPGWQTVLRSDSIYGPFERKVVLETGMTGINGPHQGAIVDTPDGQWWFYHFQQVGARGRVVHLQPMHWEDGWPVIGVDQDRNGIGEPVYCWKMPYSGTTPSKPATSDNFDSTSLGLQWQFNHNPADGWWSLTENPGKFTIHALKAGGFHQARNSLTQKLVGYKGCISVTMEAAGMAEGQHCGLAVMSDCDYAIGLRCADGSTELYYDVDGEVRETAAFSGKKIYLRTVYDTDAESFHFEYSADGKAFEGFGAAFSPDFGYWKGARPALFCYNTSEDGGSACFDDFAVQYDVQPRTELFANPVIARDWPDPTIWENGGTYYSVATGLRTLMTSKDMVHWTDTGRSPVTDQARAELTGRTNNIWAPCVTKIGDRWVLYVSLYVTDDKCSIAVMDSATPDGPFDWKGILIDGVPDFGIVNAIDPFTLVVEGRVWHFFGSLEDGIHLVELTADGLKVKDGAQPVHVAGVRHPAHKFISEAYEGTYVMKKNGWWYFFASGGAYYDETYHLVVARSRDLGGPYYDREGNLFTDGKAQPVLASKKGDHIIGPGHNGDVFETSDGRTYMYYHSHMTDIDPNDRYTLLQQVFWDEEGWPYFKDGRPAEKEIMP